MPALAKTILIVSNSDDPNWKSVADKLNMRGYNVLVYEADKTADGRIPLDLHITQKAGLRLQYGDRQVDLEGLAAAWYRTPNGLQNGSPGYPSLTERSLEKQRRLLHYSLWDSVPGRTWLNIPKRMFHAEHKLTQLQVARQVGFDIPDTVVTNRWGTVDRSLPQSIIFKLPLCVLEDADTDRMVPTTPYKNQPSKLPTSSNPFPGLWQPHLPKAREWRVVVVGDKMFVGAIHTKANAKDDWRIHAHDGSVEFKKGAFPVEQKKQCYQYLNAFGLRYGVFDFIEDHKGKIIFLECNHNGQYGELEDRLNLPVTQAIVDELDRIAQSNS